MTTKAEYKEMYESAENEVKELSGEIEGLKKDLEAVGPDTVHFEAYDEALREVWGFIRSYYYAGNDVPMDNLMSEFPAFAEYV